VEVVVPPPPVPPPVPPEPVPVFFLGFLGFTTRLGATLELLRVLADLTGATA
jgi:hypothetical protein